MKNLVFLFMMLPLTSFSQELFRYNFADTIMEKITTPYFLSEKLIYFDTSYVQQEDNGNSFFKIGKVCKQFGCKGDFDRTGKIQTGWWIIENKIVISYMAPIVNGSFNTLLKVWRWDNKIKKFILIL